MSECLPPIERTIRVSWKPEDAFRRFTEDFGKWWPRATHSVGGPEVERLVFEMKVGGGIYEVHRSGRRFQWGRIVEWTPPGRVRFSWHPSRDPATAQDVTVEFTEDGDATLVRLVSAGWEHWGEGAKKARRGYDVGWGYVLGIYAGRRTVSMRLLDGIAALMLFVQRFRGGWQGTIKKAKGEIAPGETAAR